VPLATVNPDKLLPGLITSLDLEETLRRFGQLDPELLPQLADGALIIIFAPIQMPRGGRIPRARETILFQRAFLEKQFAARIEHQHMNRPMVELAPVNFAARRLANHLVPVVDHVKVLSAHGPKLGPAAQSVEQIVRGGLLLRGFAGGAGVRRGPLPKRLPASLS